MHLAVTLRWYCTLYQAARTPNHHNVTKLSQMGCRTLSSLSMRAQTYVVLISHCGQTNNAKLRPSVTKHTYIESYIVTAAMPCEHHSAPDTPGCNVSKNAAGGQHAFRMRALHLQLGKHNAHGQLRSLHRLGGGKQTYVVQINQQRCTATCQQVNPS